MDSEYIITPTGSFVNTDELYHHGIVGMKWGVRRYQNSDGSLTDRGRKRYLNDNGTLTKKGEKYYAKESERLKAERKTLRAQKSATRKLTKLEEMRKKNAELEEEVNGKKTNDDNKSSSTNSTVKKSEAYDMSSLSNEDLKKYSSRMQVEDNFKQLLEKRGYKVSLDQKTEIDQRIEALNKEKTLRQLEKEVDKMNRGKTDTERKIEELTQKRDITKLEKEIRDNTPKKESKLSKFLNSQAGSALTTQLVKSGENVLTAYINGKNSGSSKGNSDNNSGNKSKDDKSKNDKVSSDMTSEAVKATTSRVSKILSKEASKVSKSYEKQTEKQAKREAKAAEKEAKNLGKEADRLARDMDKQSKRWAKQEAKAEKQSTQTESQQTKTKTYEGTVEGEGTSRSSIKNGSRKGPVVDVNDHVQTYSNTPVTSMTTTYGRSKGYDYIKRIETDYGYRYIYELPSGS